VELIKTSANAHLANLEKVDHIVVLMLENRSFDHMLGYLSLSGRRPDIDGLRPDFFNEYRGHIYPIHHLNTTTVGVDPDHSASAIDMQISDGTMGGFVSSLMTNGGDRVRHEDDPAPVMGYYDAADLPVYDHLAEEFTVCDRWFSSVPGSTWPNRLYALCGRAAGSRDDLPPFVPPLYHLPSFVRHLDEHHVSWRWYSFDPGTLRLADARYVLGHAGQFAYFSTTGLPWKAVLDVSVSTNVACFLDAAARGTLPSVSWIDPAFTSFNPLGFPVNDDHPTADIADGQDLALAVYDALATSPQWSRSMLVIVYDEHGGFFDHVTPPQAADDNPETFGRYGVRVPTIIVSPWVDPRSVSSTVFDHTSIIKTILLRFCPGALQNSEGCGDNLNPNRPQYPGTRVAHASHLGELLTRTAPRPAPRRDGLLHDAAARASGQAGTVNPTTRRPSGGSQEPDDLQKRILAATYELHRRGHPTYAP
jgi:phospholipase C